MSLLDVARKAKDSSEDVDLALLKATENENSIRGAWLLASCISISPEHFTTLFHELWPSCDADRALADLKASPWLDTGGDGIRIVTSIGSAVVSDFFLRDESNAIRAHTRLAQLEGSKLTALNVSKPRSTPSEQFAGASASDGWFAYVRQSYYLAVPNPSDAAWRFMTAFVHPPVADTDGARQWLTSLVLRQASHFFGQPREFLFFRAFETFTRGDNPAVALPALSQVRNDALADPFTAFSLYLIGVLESLSRDPASVVRALTTLERAARLSQDLKLLDVEVRARRSLCEAAISVLNAETQLSEGELRNVVSEAQGLVKFNQERADQSGNSVLALRNSWTAAKLDWLALRFREAGPGDVTRAAAQILSRLAEVRVGLADANDIQAVLLISRDAAAILATISRVDEAVNEINNALDATDWGEAPAALLRLRKETERIRDEARTAESRDELDVLLARIARAGAG